MTSFFLTCEDKATLHFHWQQALKAFETGPKTFPFVEVDEDTHWAGSI